MNIPLYEFFPSFNEYAFICIFPVFSALVAFLFSAGNFNGKMHYRNYVVRIRVKLVFLVCVGGCFRLNVMSNDTIILTSGILE